MSSWSAALLPPGEKLALLYPAGQLYEGVLKGVLARLG